MYDNNKEAEALKKYIRPVTDEDRRKLPTFSHSKLETFENCSYRYLLQYEQQKRSNDTTLALELGTICHRVYEIGAQMWKEGCVNYDRLKFLLEHGDPSERILGTKDLTKKYFEEWYEPDSEGHTYPWKMDNFEKGLHEYLNNFSYGGWVPFKEECHFEFVFNNRAIIMGYIDAILINNQGDFWVQDFKTSKKIFGKDKIPTSQQFSIYCMAVLNEFGKLPIKCDYNFILLNQMQDALTDGFAKRIVKKLNNVFDKIEKNRTSGIWTPSASPLCYFCGYSFTNPKAKEFKNECEYYSLWNPTDRNFSVNKKFNALDLTNNKNVSNIESDTNKLKPVRKLIF